ncbi:hypothetical protein [Mycolicibacterium sp.]
MKIINWLNEWWVTWRVWRRADEEQRRILTGPFDLDDYVEVERPGDGL